MGWMEGEVKHVSSTVCHRVTKQIFLASNDQFINQQSIP
jgi:hypothetical protein